MSLKLTFHKNIYYNLIILITFFLFVFAFTQIIYWQTNQSNTWYIIYRLALFIIFALDCIYIFLCILNHSKVTGFFLLVVSVLIYETIISLFINYISFSDLVLNGYTWPLTFLVFYLFAIYWDVNAVFPTIRKIVVVGSFICMILLINNVRIHLFGTMYDPYGGIVGPVYFCMSFLGLILFVGTEREKIFFSIFSILLLLFSGKRTGIIIVLVGLFIYLLIDAQIQRHMQARLRRYLFVVLILIIAVIAGLIVIDVFDLDVIQRFIDVSDEGGSGRFIAWEKVISYFDKSDIFNKIFGNGFHTVPIEVQPLGRSIYAHNSFLETLYDLGIVGLLCITGIIVYLLYKLIQMIREKNFCSSVLAYSMVEILLLSTFGYMFDESRFIMPVVMLWGLCLGKYKREKKCSRELLEKESYLPQNDSNSQ